MHKDQGALSKIQIVDNGKEVVFHVVHNFPAFNIDLQDLIDRYIHRPKWMLRKGYTPQGFCDFALKRNRQPGVFCVPQADFNRIMKDAGHEPEIEQFLIQNDQKN